uniref:Angiotensin-converting enzyme 2 n=1 Tax=Picea sitchensis TaxID=3332 RepID=A9NLY7_PICSI|nr:unknown [Picea sitchensis]
MPGARSQKPDATAPPSYIFLVQHLIEKCLVFNMDQQECVDALSKHANIQPLITITVWNELKKENEEFFSSYLQKQNRRK